MIEMIKKELVTYFGKMAEFQAIGIVGWVKELER